MSTFECEQLVQQYAEWVKRNLAVQQQGGVCIITSPFLDRHHDYLQIYVDHTESGLLLSDDGYTLRDLQISGLEINTDRRMEALDQAILPFGVLLVGDELQIVASAEDFPQKKHDLLQAMLAAGDLIHLAQETIVTVFKEDVERYLKAQNVRFIPDVRLMGTSGFHHPFDFVIPRSQQNPDRYIRAVNNPSRANIVEVLFTWQDVHPIRSPDAKMVTVLNDEEHRISPDNLAALDKYGIEVIRWTDRDNRVVTLQD